MARQRKHGDDGYSVTPHPANRYADTIVLVRGRRGPLNRTWEARVRLPDRTWTGIFSLKTTDFEEAKVRAVEELMKRGQLQASGLPQPARRPTPKPVRPQNTFGNAAKSTIKGLEDLCRSAVGAGSASKAHNWKQHIGRIRNILLPAWGDTPVTELSASGMNTWMKSFRLTNGGVPTKNTVGNINHSFRLVMQTAADFNWIRSDDMPSISKRGFPHGTPRPSFTFEEIEQLRDFMTDAWVSAARKDLSEEIRYLLRAYVALATTSGIRPGLELERIHVRQIRFETHRQRPVIRIPILAHQAKYKEPRDVYLRETDAFYVRGILNDLIAWRVKRGGTAADLLFARPSDGVVPVFSRPFKTVLVETGLLLDTETNLPRQPYSARHYFATQALLRGVDVHTLSQWMGTSVAMIEAYYAKVILRLKASVLAGTDDRLAFARAALRHEEAARQFEPTADDDDFRDVA